MNGIVDLSHVWSQDIIKVAFDNGINMFDTAEAYAGGKSELEMYVPIPCQNLFSINEHATKSRGRVIKELGLRRTDLVVTTKLFWGLRKGPNDSGLSRKQ